MMSDKPSSQYDKRDSLWIIHGDDYIKMTLALLEELNPAQSLDRNADIGIKPNLVCASPAARGATTHPEIIEGIIIYLRDLGFKRITILEGSWVGDSTQKAFKVCGYNALAQKYQVPLLDLKKDSATALQYKDLKIKVCKRVQDLDYLINVPLIKGHCQTQITCALKNLKGVITDGEKRRFHSMGLHRPIAFLNKLVKPDLIIADDICADPYFEEGGRPGDSKRIVAGFDPVLMDSYAAQCLGYEPDEIEYISLAAREGVGTSPGIHGPAALSGEPVRGAAPKPQNKTPGLTGDQAPARGLLGLLQQSIVRAILHGPGTGRENRPGPHRHRPGLARVG